MAGKKKLILWVDWSMYHVDRLAALCRGSEGQTSGIELVGGTGLNGNLQFRTPDRKGLPIITLMPDRNWTDAGKARLTARVWRSLQRLRPDAVFVPGYYLLPALAGAVWGRLNGATTVLMSDSTFEDSPRSAAREAVKRMVVKLLFDRAVASGKRAAKYLESLGFKAEQIAKSYDVVDNDFYGAGTETLRQTSASRGGETAGNRFLFVGRLAPEKNVDGLIRAYKEYRRAGGRWGLTLAGEGPLREELRQRAEAGSRGDDIHFAGHKSPGELLAYYAHTKALILPSTREPWGLVVNEAMASGLPVIVSNRCGCADDLVEHEGNGFLFDPSREDELTAYMLRLSAMTEEERAAMGRRSKEIIRNYSLETWASEVTRIAGD